MPRPLSALSRLATSLRAALLRAGAAGALHGGAPGDPHVGLIVPLASVADLRGVLDTLGHLKTQATLLVEPDLARRAPEELRAASAAGHELAGQGDPAGLTLLEAVAGQGIELWAAGRRPLRELTARGLKPLTGPASPSSAPQAAPGQLLWAEPTSLRATLERWQGLGYRPVPVGRVPGLRAATPRDLFIHLYTRVVEDRFAREHGVIDLAQRADAVMRVAPRPEAPEPLPLPRRTAVAELHLHSPRIVGINARSSIAAYRAYQRSLGDVAQALRTRPELAEAQAVFAVTLFHGPLEKNGFAVLDLPPAQARWYGLGFRLLRVVYGTPKPPSEATPKMAWMTREAFLARHGRS